MPVQIRKALVSDLDGISRIYNQGISERTATFETGHRTPRELEPWLKSGFPVMVAVENSGIVGFAASFPYSSRHCYRGIGEFSVYVQRSSRGHGIGAISVKALILEAETAGLWKLVSKVFVENTASRHMLNRMGFREIGIHERHAKLDGIWKDVVLVEYLITSNMN